MSPNTQEAIQGFLALRRLAIVGVSRHPGDFSRALFREFSNRDYDVVPVNPNAGEIEGKKCFATLREIEPPVDGALLMTDPANTESVMHDCGAAGIERVWMFRGAGRGAVSDAAVAYGRDHGMKMVVGECPFMFLAESGWIHRAHGFIRKITGKYPS